MTDDYLHHRLVGGWFQGFPSTFAGCYDDQQNRDEAVGSHSLNLVVTLMCEPAFGVTKKALTLPNRAEKELYEFIVYKGVNLAMFYHSEAGPVCRKCQHTLEKKVDRQVSAAYQIQL